MNPGILKTEYASPQTPYGLLGVPQPVPMVDPRREPNWRIVGSSVWSLYRSSILRTMRTAAVRDTLTTPSGSYPGGAAYFGGVLLPDGRVFCVPRGATTARIYDPVTNTLTTPSGSYPGAAAYNGGVLLPDGRVFCVPASATTARIYDPVTNTLTTPSGSYPGGTAYGGGVLLPDGRVFCVPTNATTARIYGGGRSFDVNVLLSAYFNKF